jgi:hypothetical protein
MTIKQNIRLLTAYLQNRGFLVRLKDSGNMLHLGS